MAKFSPVSRINRNMLSSLYRLHFTVHRGILSEAYLCEEAWQKRLESPLLKNIKMDQYFIETDKKFGTKRLVSGIDLDLFGNNVQEESQLDELEHLLYRFRRTKRAVEMMDSTNYAVVRTFLKYHQYESLFRILHDRESYGVFPDLYTYNILMSTFLKEKLQKEAAHVAILMMLQEDFSNKISCVLGIFSCQTFLNECSLSSLNSPTEQVQETESTEESKKEDDEEEEEETLVRVPFLRNYWFDDHFNITEPKHLIGKTFYLLGRELDDVLGRSYQILGLAMYEKWEKAFALLTSFTESKDLSLLSETVQQVKLQIEAIPEDEEKNKKKWLNKFEGLFQKMEADNKLQDGQFMSTLQEKLTEVLKLQNEDIEAQKKLFSEWENQRKLAIDKQNAELEKERRLKAIEEKKEYLFWKEKLLYFFENEDKNLKELKEVEEMVASIKKSKPAEDLYVPPEIIKRRNEKVSKYKKLARVKVL